MEGDDEKEMEKRERERESERKGGTPQDESQINRRKQTEKLEKSLS